MLSGYVGRIFVRLSAQGTAHGLYSRGSGALMITGCNLVHLKGRRQQGAKIHGRGFDSLVRLYPVTRVP